MKKLPLILAMSLGLVVGADSFAIAESEYDKMLANNQVMKDCLAAHGYNPNVLLQGKNFNWSKASSCYQDWKSGKLNEEYLELRTFLKENPWYTGNNWDWEIQAKAGWNCVKYYETGEKICRKPQFIK